MGESSGEGFLEGEGIIVKSLRMSRNRPGKEERMRLQGQCYHAWTSLVV